MSLVPEDWLTVGRSEEDGDQIVYVARLMVEPQRQITVWKLRHYATRGWRSVGQFLSTGRYRTFPERYGVKLTDSRLDQILLACATQATENLI